MEILRCRRCQQNWCYHGHGRAYRCGRCGTPYWDRDWIRGPMEMVPRKPLAGPGRALGASPAPVVAATAVLEERALLCELCGEQLPKHKRGCSNR